MLMCLYSLGISLVEKLVSLCDQFPQANPYQEQRAGIVHEVTHYQGGSISNDQADYGHQHLRQREEDC